MPPNTDPTSHSLVRKLHDEAGDALRSVTRYDEEEYEFLYLRENVEAIYSAEEFDAIFDDLRLEGWGRESLEDLFRAGELECSIYGFEGAMMFHFVTDDFDGALVTYDRDADVDAMDFLDVCKAELAP